MKIYFKLIVPWLVVLAYDWISSYLLAKVVDRWMESPLTATEMVLFTGALVYTLVTGILYLKVSLDNP